MNLTRDRLNTIGWGFALTLCATLVLALTFRVNAVKSEVRLAERHIAQLRQEKMFLETEFETRASQQQLEAFNDVDFGYTAPTAGQYLDGERALAALGKPRSPDAPAPIRVASVDAVQSVRAMPALAQQFAPSPAPVKAAKASVVADAKADAKPAAKKLAHSGGLRE